MPPRSLNALLADIQARPSVYFPALGKGGAGRTAQAATYLNYGPQFDALAAMLGGAREARRTGVQSAQRSGQAGAQGITKIRDSFVQGAGDTLGSLGGPVASGAPVASPEARAAQQLGLSGTALAGMLSGMAAQQVAGVGNQTRQLNRQFQTDRQQIGDKIGALFGQAGAYNTQQFETLAGARRKEAAAAKAADARLRATLMGNGINPDTGQFDDSLVAPKEAKIPTINSHGYTAEAWAAMPLKERRRIIAGDKSSGNKGPSPAETRDRVERYAKVRDSIESVSSIAEALFNTPAYRDADGNIVKKDAPGAKKSTYTERDLQKFMEQKYASSPPVVRRAAVEMAVYGKMSLDTFKDLRRRYKKIEMPSDWVARNPNRQPGPNLDAAGSFDW